MTMYEIFKANLIPSSAKLSYYIVIMPPSSIDPNLEVLLEVQGMFPMTSVLYVYLYTCLYTCIPVCIPGDVRLGSWVEKVPSYLRDAAHAQTRGNTWIGGTTTLLLPWNKRNGIRCKHECIFVSEADYKYKFD